MMNSSDLRFFEAVARLGSMNKAARELHTVQSNVTLRIRQLEEMVGAKLFERLSEGVKLTEAGQRLQPFAQRSRDLMTDALQAVQDKGDPSGKLEIGSLETTAAYRLTGILLNVASIFPNIDLALRIGTNAQLIKQVLSGNIDGAFVCGPVVDDALACETVFIEHLVIATAKHHDTIEQFLGVCDRKILVKGAGCAYRQRFEELFVRRGMSGLRHMEFGTLDAILACVSAGLGATLLPRSVIENSRHADLIAMLPLTAEDRTVETVFIRRRNGHMSSALRAFRQILLPNAAVQQAAE